MDSRIVELEKLKALLDRGVISQEELAKEKARLLRTGPSPAVIVAGVSAAVALGAVAALAIMLYKFRIPAQRTRVARPFTSRRHPGYTW